MLCFLTSLLISSSLVCAGNPERIRLDELKVLTLTRGQYTTARRSHAVLQLQCVGGTAGCNTFVPQVVQCYNRGSDGYDVQWECKSDMDNAYRFGQIAVNCEGYDYPDDPYVLRGSCGLEYNLDLTKEGFEHQNQHHSSNYNHSDGTNYGGTFLSVVIFIIALIVIGSVIRMCLTQHQQHHDSPPPYPGYTVPPTAPPPPGYNPNMASGPGYPSSPGWQQQQPYTDYSSHTTHTGWQQPHMPTAGGGGGFWSGAMTGGALGYLFGSRGQSHSRYSTPPPQPTSSFWSSSTAPNTSSFAGSSSGTGSSGGSTGTRTASAYGGTKRR